MTALHWAAYNNDPESVRMLLEQGALSNLNSQNLTPVDIAARCDNWDVVTVFINDYKKSIE